MESALEKRRNGSLSVSTLMRKNSAYLPIGSTRIPSLPQTLHNIFDPSELKIFAVLVVSVIRRLPRRRQSGLASPAPCLHLVAKRDARRRSIPKLFGLASAAANPAPFGPGSRRASNSWLRGRSDWNRVFRRRQRPTDWQLRLQCALPSRHPRLEDQN